MSNILKIRNNIFPSVSEKKKPIFRVATILARGLEKNSFHPLKEEMYSYHIEQLAEISTATHHTPEHIEPENHRIFFELDIV